jgi:hypothetical protein
MTRVGFFFYERGMGQKRSWFDLYRAAALETKDDLLRTRISAVRQAIAARLQELALDPRASSEECQEIKDALTALQTIEGERIPP